MKKLSLEQHEFDIIREVFAERLLDLREMIDKYATQRDSEGKGGNIYLKMFMSKNGKPCCSVWDPNSEAAKEKRAAKQAKTEAVTDDMPF